MDKVDISRWRDFVMDMEWVGGHIWFLGWGYDFVINEILNLMT